MQISKRRIIIPALILAFFLLAVGYKAKFIYEQQFISFNRKSVYLPIKGYSDELGLDAFNESSIIRKYGVSRVQIRSVDQNNENRVLILDQYPKFDVLYVYTDWYASKPYNTLICIIFKDNSLRFGKLQIGIGSTQEEVHRAYAKEPMVSTEELAYSAEDYPNVDEGFYGEDWSRILFCYDENGVVESMAYEPPAF